MNKNNNLIKIVLPFFWIILFSLGLYGSEERVKFNTEKIVIHQPIQSLLDAAQEDIVQEPSMNQATVQFAWENGGELTKSILSELKKVLSREEYQRLRIDIKVQQLVPNSYANTPGWHSDYYGGIDPDTGYLKRYNPGFESDTKIFLILTGEPATEVTTLRNVGMDFHTTSWENLSDVFDSIPKLGRLFRIPVATPVELRGNELHRVTPYLGNEPIFRYLMRATVFPEGHSEYGLFKNELFDWEIHEMPPLETILGDVSGFLDKAFKNIAEAGVDVSLMEMTHLAYRVATIDEYEAKKRALAKAGTKISEVQADGRPYAVFKLYSPIKYQGFEAKLIALPAPKPDNHYQTGLQHVAFLMKEDIAHLIDQYPNIEFDIAEYHRRAHPEIKLRFPELVVKFHNLSLEDLVK